MRGDDHIRAANVIACVLGVATSGASVAGVGAGIATLAAVADLVRNLSGRAPRLEARIAQDLKAALRAQGTLSETSRILIPQMVQAAALTPHEIMGAARQPAEIVARMLGKMTDREHQTPLIEQQFKDVMIPLLTSLLGDHALNDTLHPAFEDAVALTLRQIGEQVERMAWSEATGEDTNRKVTEQSQTLAGQSQTLADILATVSKLQQSDGERRDLLDQVARMRSERSTSDKMIAEFLHTVIDQNLPPDQFQAGLASISESWFRMKVDLDLLSQKSNLSPELDGLRAQAKSAYGAEDRPTLRRLLDRIEALQRASIKEQRARLEQEKSEFVETLRAQLRLAETEFRAEDTSRLITELKELEIRPASLFLSLRVERNNWYVRGRDKGLAFDLQVSIALARASVDHAVTPDDRGAALNDLGVSLRNLGSREPGTARLEQAVMAYRATLEEWTRDRVPQQWAGTQNNLGSALGEIGRREPGTARLEEAVTAYRAALAEWTRDLEPLEWAMTQNNLGTALRSLGEREPGTARLAEAVTAHRAALDEHTRDYVPLAWATTQNNLGAALHSLGEREPGTARLEEAATAYRAALEERTRDRVPLDWAMTQNNLGAALSTLGERQPGTERLEEAVTAYHAALEERTRDRVPLDWAGSWGGLGVTMGVLADRRSDLVMARQALQQIVEAEAQMRAGGHEPHADFYAAQIPVVQAVINRLS